MKVLSTTLKEIENMRAERLVLETDEQGQIKGLPVLPPKARVEVIVLLLEESAGQPKRRRPSPALKDMMQIVGDITSPVADESDWEALR
jgi:hypothetical protein